MQPVELRSSDGGRAPKLLFTVHRRLLAAPQFRGAPCNQLLSASDDDVSSAPSWRGITPKGQLRALPASSQLNCDTSYHQRLNTDRSARQLHPTLCGQFLRGDASMLLRVVDRATRSAVPRRRRYSPRAGPFQPTTTSKVRVAEQSCEPETRGCSSHPECSRKPQRTAQFTDAFEAPT
jgi:hypothetical protein